MMGSWVLLMTHHRFEWERERMRAKKNKTKNEKPARMSPIKIEFVAAKERKKEKQNKERLRVNKNVDVWQLTSFSFARKTKEKKNRTNGKRATDQNPHIYNISLIIIIMIRQTWMLSCAFVAIWISNLSARGIISRLAMIKMQTHIVCECVCVCLLEFRVMDSGQRARAHIKIPSNDFFQE